ncbi:MAG TPA: S-adenosylmethionine:tRNA ribosyltransferase-isomerase, partial [Bacteroidales bacterium]|nr:S-adenosylmethionine:tRNA ribosyltransferase-isomerase [Bacteroidales bacterium]
LIAEKMCQEGESWRIRFTWEPEYLSFENVLDAAGHVPLPPYIDRSDNKSDETDYQTIYSRINGSVAAPTAGLHFTNNVLEALEKKNITRKDITLHVGAGTFKPVKTSNAAEHEMHCEHFVVSRETVENLMSHKGRIIAVGTTSVRTIESLYWIGARLIKDPLNLSFSLGQWEPYLMESDITENESLMAICKYMEENKLLYLHSSTSIMIIPGYSFRMTNGIITNFHQPKSTLLLLISAWIGDEWKNIYKYALDNRFRFLSYGDSSILFRKNRDD